MKGTETLVAATATLVASPALLAAQEHGAEAGGGGGLFSINVGLSIWTVVVFLVLLLVLWKFAWGPILDAVESREQNIQEALDEAARRNREARELLREQKAELAEARHQAQEIVSEGREAGEQVRKEIEEKAREESRQILARARKEIEREKDAALDTIRRESVELAMAAASRLLEKKLDAEEDRELVMDYLDDLVASEGEVRA